MSQTQTANMTVKLLIGANSYACINTPQMEQNVLLEAGKSPAQSLKDTAAEWRAKAHRYQSMAKLVKEAAAMLEAEAAQKSAT